MTCGCSYEILETGHPRQYSDQDCLWCEKCHRIFCKNHAKIHNHYKGTRLHQMSVEPR